ncbi:MAG: histidinol-phosphatase [Deltaproteobacteria bacterium]|nr:MAG: histidinol-phosphatase [Deltaproteobacteria bacterium]
MTENEIKRLAAFTSELAQKGGECAAQWFRQQYTVSIKEDKSPVTAADQSAESLLRERIADRFPDHGVLGEEFGPLRTDQEYVWSIDPVDGTRSFITGSPLWGTLVALLHHGAPVTGAVCLPALKECWEACNDGGCWFIDTKKKVQCRTSGCTSLSAAIFSTTSPLYFAPEEKPVLEALYAAVRDTRFGGDCFIYCQLACGYVDLVVESLLKPFDFLPLIPIIQEAGGVVTDWRGNSLTLQSSGRLVAAATQELHDQALVFLQQQMNPGTHKNSRLVT